LIISNLTHPLDPSVNDAYLHRVASAVPQGAILLIEDIDCAFPSRDAEDEDEDMPPFMRIERARPLHIPSAHVTMSGVLNLMDGVASDDGRIIFATVCAMGYSSPDIVLINVLYHRPITTSDWIPHSSVLGGWMSRLSTKKRQPIRQLPFSIVSSPPTGSPLLHHLPTLILHHLPQLTLALYH
jgi:hypothetical protein